MAEIKPDFSGWATKNDIVCSDGLVIKQNAFAHYDGKKVPLVWQHEHNDPLTVLGHAILKNTPEGVRADGFFNDSESGLQAKELVKHGDVDQLSIYANRLTKDKNKVVHGNIIEVSLVMAGANKGAYIDQRYLQHDDDSDELSELLIFSGEKLFHADESEGAAVADSKKKTVEDVINTMTDEQKEAMYYLLGEAISDGDENEDEDEEEDENEEDVSHSAISTEDFLSHIDNQIKEGFDQHMAHRNVFEQNGSAANTTLTHSDAYDVLLDAKKNKMSLKDAFLAHAEAGSYGIEEIDILFPDAKALNNSPEFIKRRTEWVQEVIGGAKHSPFARIKTILADITAEEARARGYVKNTMKKDEVIKLLKRTTSPTTIYKKQRLDRDDLIDITSFDVVTWLKQEMRLMLDEELGRAILIGDGRSAGDPDKIDDPEGANNGQGIRSILRDHEMYAHPVVINKVSEPGAIVEKVLRSREHYKGTGTPVMFTTDAILTDMLLEKDRNRRRIYNNEAELAGALRVAKIIPVEVMQSEPTVIAIIVNMSDYTIGADKGGELNMFDDFDMDWNQQKYLMEVRASGALTRPKSALVLTRTEAAEVVPRMPGFNSETNTISIPTVPGVTYFIDDEPVTGSVVIEETTEVTSLPDDEFVFPTNIQTTWTFTYNSGE